MAYLRTPQADVLAAQQSATLCRCFALTTTALDVAESWAWTTCAEQVRVYDLSGGSTDYRSGCVLDVGNQRHVAGIKDSDFQLTVAIGDSPRITRQQVRSGMLRDAMLDDRLVDWLNPHHRTLRRSRWYVGDYKEDGDTVRIDFVGIASRFKQSIGWPLQPSCKHQFGDSGCDFDGHVGSTPEWQFLDYEIGPGSTRGKLVVIEGLDAFPAAGKAAENWWAYGEGVLTSGASEGERFTFRSNTVPAVVGSDWTTTMTLSTPLLVAPEVGDTISARVGCARSKSVCVSKFTNSDNFEGYDAIPGTDTMTQTPGLR